MTVNEEGVRSILKILNTVKCPRCEILYPQYLILNVRGRELCIRCHYNDIWAYIEENRRMIENHIKEHLSFDWSKTEAE